MRILRCMILLVLWAGPSGLARADSPASRDPADLAAGDAHARTHAKRALASYPAEEEANPCSPPAAPAKERPAEPATVPDSR